MTTPSPATAPFNGKPLGLSAFIRAKNEQRWIAAAVQSIVEDVDEVVVCLQPSFDKTAAIVEGLQNSKVRIVHYPVETRPFGPGFDQQDATSPDCWTYFCNWSVAQTRFSSAIRWDADHVAIPRAIKTIRELLNRYDVIFDVGVNIVSRDLRISRISPQTAYEARNFRVLRGFRFVNGSTSELFHRPKWHTNGWWIWKSRKLFLRTPTFLHLKWLKTDREMSGWPSNWRSEEYFSRFAPYRESGQIYSGPLPTFDFLALEQG